jgi:hypothetical protein
MQYAFLCLAQMPKNNKAWGSVSSHVHGNPHGSQVRNLENWADDISAEVL